MSVKRQRRPSEESRERAVDAARTLLIEGGPAAVTLKAVAGRLGQSHANLLHHFGTVGGLHAALVEAMARDITHRIGEAVKSARRGEVDPSRIVDIAFDAFAKEGAGSLATWMIVQRDTEGLASMLTAMRSLMEELAVDVPAEIVANATLSLTLAALGDSLLGEPITEALGLPRDSARRLALSQLMTAAAAFYPPQKDA